MKEDDRGIEMRRKRRRDKAGCVSGWAVGRKGKGEGWRGTEGKEVKNRMTNTDKFTAILINVYFPFLMNINK